MANKIRLCSFFYVMILFFTTMLAAEESITLSTYYPAPYGDYDTIRVNSIENYTIISNPKLDRSTHNKTHDFFPVYINQALSILGDVPTPYTNMLPVEASKSVTFYGDGRVKGTLHCENGYILGIAAPNRHIVTGTVDIGRMARNTVTRRTIPHTLSKVDMITVSLHQVLDPTDKKWPYKPGGVVVATQYMDGKWYCIVENRSGEKRDVQVNFIAVGTQ